MMAYRTGIAPACLVELFAAAEYLVVADDAMMQACPSLVSPERRRRTNTLRAMIAHVRATGGRQGIRAPDQKNGD